MYSLLLYVFSFLLPTFYVLLCFAIESVLCSVYCTACRHVAAFLK